MRLNSFSNILQAPLFSFVIALICASSFTHAYENGCGTAKVIQNLIKYQKDPHYAASLYSSEKCSPESYYDSVYTIETPHFQVMYVLTGPHATTKAFADSTAASFEDAWELYVNNIKMQAPKGPSKSHHFQQDVKAGLYPVEIIDVDQVRDGQIFFGGSSSCGACFAVTVPMNNGATSQIFLDNDFNYGATYNISKESIIVDKDTCYYSKADIPLYNSTHDYYYTNEWAKGIRLTAFHEFYHAVQLSYLNMYSNSTFWFEASATGFEEITNPEVDDYLRYLPSFFDKTGNPLSATFRNYGASTLFLYLYYKVSKNLDKSIWENFSKNPNKNFESQLEASLKAHELDADSVFHDYAVRLSFSGARSKKLQKKEWINEDQSQWASARYRLDDLIKPELESLAFDFFSKQQNTQDVDLSNFVGKATVIAYHDSEATIHRISSNKTLDSLASFFSTCDSTLWIFSRFGKSESIPITTSTSDPHAFPVPWKHGALCFGPLPSDKKFFEIRNRRGDLVTQQKYEGTTFCLQEDQVKAMMAPGIYRFRVGNKSKTKSFIVIY